MMISPQGFLEYYKDKSYKELLPVRDELPAAIFSFEEQKDDPIGGIVCPSPEVTGRQVREFGSRRTYKGYNEKQVIEYAVVAK